MDNGKDIEGFMTGIYANAVPCLCTYPNEVSRGFQVSQIATTLRHEDGRGYNHTYNYFDPDNYFSISAILFSGDEYLLNQARLVIERSGSFIKNETGQLPHHFEGIEPVSITVFVVLEYIRMVCAYVMLLRSHTDIDLFSTIRRNSNGS